MKAKQVKSRAKHDRLLRLFDSEGYEEFHTPKYVFVKQWNGNNNQWQVAIYPIASWSRMNIYKDTFTPEKHLRQVMLED
jgi:hypothetical protein